MSLAFPVYRWILEGDLVDAYGEFFVLVNEDMKDEDERLWHHKYSMRQAMIPKYVSIYTYMIMSTITLSSHIIIIIIMHACIQVHPRAFSSKDLGDWQVHQFHEKML